MARLARILVLLVFSAALSGCGSAPATGLQRAALAAPPYEVWAADQNTDTIYVLDPAGKVLRTLDGATLRGARRPHMLWGVPGDEYVYSANTVSNSVTVLSSRDGTVKAVIDDVGKSPHAAQPNPRQPDRIYVANIGPQETRNGRPDRGETITELVRSAGPGWEVARVLDLKSAPALADSARFPSRRPVCFGFSRDGRYMLVTLFNGGLAVVDLPTWTVVKSWGKDAIAEHGCGFATSPGGEEIYVTAGGLHASWLYVFDARSEPHLVASHDLSKWGQDAHGVVVDRLGGTLWVLHRVSSNVTVHPLATIRQPGQNPAVIDFVGKTPDLILLSPDSRLAYLTLRGPKPAPTIPHATVGDTPGIAIVDVPARRLLDVVRLGDQVAGDFHGLFIRGAQP
jgi:DNA-binding beta-propeller fold protein YncE